MTQVGGALAICLVNAPINWGRKICGCFLILAWYLSGILVPCASCLVAASAAKGRRTKNKEAWRYRNYLAVIGTRQSIAISTLASASGCLPAGSGTIWPICWEGILPQGFLIMVGTGWSQC